MCTVLLSMNIKKKLINQEDNIKNRYDTGLKGQNFIESCLTNKGYELYKKNLKKIGLELDLVVYKHIRDKNILVVRIVEVKTRTIDVNYSSFLQNKETDLSQFAIPRKWKKVKTIMFDTVNDVKNEFNLKDTRHRISFDLAIVYLLLPSKHFKIHRYIENVNLLL